ncbi:hypothetical protein OIPHN260_00820 [Enterobacter roggenkampii]|uniref:Uncharacterized protein n=1 Tax=Enterobacter roggenkampii TaxID=1812935 RepID=A0AAU9BLJ0_9ENTR|nr:hypothetical protein OIPHN260_00820 [Enterobacter roggenkampii]
MMSLWDALRMNMMISYQELVRTFLNGAIIFGKGEYLKRYFDKIEVIKALRIADKKE